MGLPEWLEILGVLGGIAGFVGGFASLKLRHRQALELERFRGEQRDREARLDSVRSAVMAALSDSQTGLNERRLKAIDDLWRAAMASKAGSGVVQVVSKLDLARIGTPEPNIQQFAKGFDPWLTALEARQGSASDAQLARPFVSPMAWALYSAYDRVIMQAAVQLKAIQSGVDPVRFVKTAETLALVRAVLPEYGTMVDEFGQAAYSELLPEIEERLLRELRETAQGHGWDAESVERSHRILKLAEAVKADRIGV